LAIYTFKPISVFDLAACFKSQHITDFITSGSTFMQLEKHIVAKRQIGKSNFMVGV
jgi:hypothetical protein